MIWGYTPMYGNPHLDPCGVSRWFRTPLELEYLFYVWKHLRINLGLSRNPEKMSWFTGAWNMEWSAMFPKQTKGFVFDVFFALSHVSKALVVFNSKQFSVNCPPFITELSQTKIKILEDQQWESSLWTSLMEGRADFSAPLRLRGVVVLFG